MAKARALTFDDLPLFALDRDIAAAVVGADPEAQRKWCASVSTLESTGFPKPSKLYGMRYTPAVRAFYDRQYGPIPTPEPAGSAQWTSPPSRRRA